MSKKNDLYQSGINRLGKKEIGEELWKDKDGVAWLSDNPSKVETSYE